RHGVEHAEILEATATNLRRPAWATPKPPSKKQSVWIGGAAAVVLLGALVWLLSGSEDEAPPSPVATASAPSDASTPDNELESLLARADQAIARGALTAPPGDNAVELYRLAQRR